MSNLKALLDWEEIRIRLAPLHQKKVDLGGQRPYDSLKIFKDLLLSQWFCLSDRQLEESLLLCLDFIYFTELDEKIPDETTLCRYRNRMNQLNLWEKLFNLINQQLSDLRLLHNLS